MESGLPAHAMLMPPQIHKSTSSEPPPPAPLPSLPLLGCPSAWDPSSRTPNSSSSVLHDHDLASRTAIPPSSQPLTRATPLPPSWTQPVVPPPSSSLHRMQPFLIYHLLCTHLVEPIAPWFAAPSLTGKRLSVFLKDTKPLFRDPGSKHGKYEGKRGTISTSDHTVDNEAATVIINIAETFRVPARYIKPDHPTMKGLNVVVISDEQLGNEYTVVEHGTLQCSLKPRGKRGRKIEVTLPTDTLCVVY